MSEVPIDARKMAAELRLLYEPFAFLASDEWQEAYRARLAELDAAAESSS